MNDKEIAEQFKVVESVTVEGVTDGYALYNISLFKNKISEFTKSLELDFERVVNVMENKNKEKEIIVKEKNYSILKILKSPI
jgi:CRISPR/Cas system-associated protein endoribonuclease Cas2